MLKGVKVEIYEEPRAAADCKFRIQLHPNILDSSKEIWNFKSATSIFQNGVFASSNFPFDNGKNKAKTGRCCTFYAERLGFFRFPFSALSSIAFGCPVPVTVALVYTQPFFTAIISFISGRENHQQRRSLS